jgi:hypothetical protein
MDMVLCAVWVAAFQVAPTPATGIGEGVIGLSLLSSDFGARSVADSARDSSKSAPWCSGEEPSFPPRSSSDAIFKRRNLRPNLLCNAKRDYNYQQQQWQQQRQQWRLMQSMGDKMKLNQGLNSHKATCTETMWAWPSLWFEMKRALKAPVTW